jgi:hypothetical protein
MAELRASPVVNPSYKRIADVLANLQGPMGEIIPFTDANPFKFLMPAASTFENLAYGNSPLSEYAGVTNRRLPIVKTGRENELTDIADVALMASGLPMASRGVARGANYLGDVLTQATRAAPPEAPMRGLDEIARMSPVPQAMSGSRDLIRSSADNLAQELNGLGFQAKVQHSGSRAGPSSYVQIYDPETGRFFTKPIRFSGHGKGPFEAAGVIDVQDPTTDIPNIVQEALQMRGMGPSATLQKQAQKQAIADELIAGGMKPKKAYAEAEKKIAGLLEPQAGATKTPPEVPKSLLDNPNLRNWVKGSEAVKESGEPITLYHATTHDFDTFSLNRANPENHYGRGFYLTDSVDDANLNYAGIGPDLEIRIERRTEQLADELMDMDAEEIADMAKSLEVDDSLIDLSKIEESGASPELIREIATKELTTHGGAVMPVFARLRNPVKVGTKDETTFRIDTEFDDAGDVVSESGDGVDLYNSLNDVGRQYDIPRDQIGDVWAKISDEMAGDEITAGRVDKIIRDNIYDVYTPDGEFAGSGQFIADVFRDMGFDGIKMDAGKYFGPRQVGTGIKVKGMEGVKDATHYILFEPTQIKSATGNIGTYSLTDPSIIRGAGIGAAGLLGAGMYQDESIPLTKFLER